MVESMYCRIELTADENEGIADVFLVRGAIRPADEDLLQLLRETEQTRHSALHFSLTTRLRVEIGGRGGCAEGRDGGGVR